MFFGFFFLKYLGVFSFLFTFSSKYFKFYSSIDGGGGGLVAKSSLTLAILQVITLEYVTIAVKQREVKSKGEKERYSQLNAEIQRIARRDKKAFLSDQCEDIEENNRKGKARDLFKKIRDTKGIFHAKMCSIKDRNGMDLTEAEDLRGGKNTQKNCTKRIFRARIIMIV